MVDLSAGNPQNRRKKKVTREPERKRNMNEDLKQSVDFAYALCAEVEKTLQNTITLHKPLKQLLQTELLVYAMYLSDSDEQIRHSESHFLQDYLGYDYSPGEVRSFLQKLDRDQFSRTIPYVFSLFVKADNILYERHRKISLASNALYEIYEALGIEMISIDDDVDLQEYQDLIRYLKMLRLYLDNHLDSSKNNSIVH